MTAPVNAPARRTLSAITKMYAALARMAPFAARDVRDAAALDTFRAVCMAAYARRGRFGLIVLIWTGARECADLLGVVLLARFAELPGVRAPRLAPVWRDLRMASRSLWHGRRTTAVAVVTLAAGIGVNAAVFSVLDATLWRQMPFADGPRLVELWNFSTAQKFSYNGMPRPLILEWRKQTDLFDRVEAYERQSFIFETGRGSEMLAGAVMTPAAFDMLGVAAARGRAFAGGEGRGGSSHVAVVSDAFWREKLGAPRDLSHRTVQLNGADYQVIGVMPRSFRFPSGVEEVWTPYDLNEPATDIVAPRAMTAFGRLRQGVTVADASKAVRTRGARLSVATGGPAELTGELIQPGHFVDERTEQSLWVLSGAVAFLFLIVCANVANLTLSRSLTRARELATAAALGASPADLVRVTVFEQLLLAGLGGAGGVGVAIGAMRVAVAAMPDSMIDGSLNVIDLDMRALVFMLAAGVTAVMLFGLAPALIAARTSVAGVLGRDNRTTTGSRPARRFRGALAIAEVAVSVVLLIGAAVMTRSFLKLASADQGYNPSGLISLRIGLPAAGYQDPALRDLAARDIADRIAGLPGVTAVTTGGLPTDTNAVAFGKTEIDTRPGELGPQTIIPIHEVPPNYFSVLGIPIVAGRALRSDDGADAAVVNQRFAAKYFPSQDAIGHRFRMEGKGWRTVVGVAGNTRANMETGIGRSELFYAIGTAADAARPVKTASAIVDYRTILIRSPQPGAVIRQLDEAVHERDTSLVIWKVALVEHLLGDAIARPRVVFMMLAVFAGFGLLLAMAGLYGVLSCLVAQRRQELGVRLALGASAAQVRRLVLGNGLMLTGIGVGIGVAAAVPLVNAMRSMLYEVSPADPAAIVGAATLLSATALLASWWPARDAGKINPVDLLRRD